MSPASSQANRDEDGGEENTGGYAAASWGGARAHPTYSPAGTSVAVGRIGCTGHDKVGRLARSHAMTETALTVGVIVLGVAAALFLTWERHDMAKARILGQLGRLHATRVELSLDWADFDRDTLTYDVVFTTPDGRRHSNRCKVSSSHMADAGVFWHRPLPERPRTEAGDRVPRMTRQDREA